MGVIKQNQQAVRFQPDGPGTVWDIFQLGEAAATGKTNPGPGKTPTYIADRFGKPVVGFSAVDPPGGQPSFTLTFWEKANVLTPRNLLSVILSEESIRLLRRKLKKATDVRVAPEEIVGAIRRILNEVALGEMENIKISLPERKQRSRKSPAGREEG